MTRIKRGNIAKRRRKKIFSMTKGFKGSHSKLFRTANQQNLKALQRSFFDRKKKKRNIKTIWIKRINAACYNLNTSYNKFIRLLKEKKILINKKILAELIIQDTNLISNI